MREIDALVGKVQNLTEDTARVLEAVKGERLSDETRAQVEALGNKLDEVNAAMDAAVPPATAPTEPTTDDGTDPEPSDGDSNSTRGHSRR